MAEAKGAVDKPANPIPMYDRIAELCFGYWHIPEDRGDLLARVVKEGRDYFAGQYKIIIVDIRQFIPLVEGVRGPDKRVVAFAGWLLPAVATSLNTDSIDEQLIELFSDTIIFVDYAERMLPEVVEWLRETEAFPMVVLVQRDDKAFQKLAKKVEREIEEIIPSIEG